MCPNLDEWEIRFEEKLNKSAFFRFVIAGIGAALVWLFAVVMFQL